MRAWSRRTLCQTLRQWMACQPGGTSGAAPASVAASSVFAADISALLLESVSRGSLVMKDQREVCRLSPRGDVAVRLNLYPLHYTTAFACSLIPYPPPRELPLRVAFPSQPLRACRANWGDDGLTTFRRSHGVG